MGHRKHRRVAERPRWQLDKSYASAPRVSVQKTIDFSAWMHGDLIYDDKAILRIKEVFPTIRIEDASDFVHTERVSIDLEGCKVTKGQWYRFLIEEGMHGISLCFELDRMSAPTSVLEWLKTWKVS